MDQKMRHLVFCFWTSSIHLLTVKAVETTRTESTAQRLDKSVPINLQSLSTEEKKKFKDSFDTIFTDCDGVLYTSKGVINNAHEAVNELIKEGKTIRYITNNGRKTKAQLAKRFTEFGFLDVTEDSIVSPVSIVADYFREKLPPGKSVYVIGFQTICDELLNQNIGCFGPGRDEINDKDAEYITKVKIEVPEAIGAVLVGLDVHINYMKILKAFRFLKTVKDCLYVVMTPEETFASSNGGEFPGNAALASAITVATGRTPFILGKPGTYMIDLLKRMAKDPQRTLFVGDSLKTDIITGHQCSFRTVLVLTGNNNLDDVQKFAQSKDAEEQLCIPEYYTNAFSDLILK